MDIENNNEDLNPEVKSTDSEDLQKIIASKVNEELAGIKEKLNAAYSQRDEAVAKAVAFEEEKKKVQIARLEEEGKHKEAADMKMAELNAKLQEREKQITELTRDNVVRDSLKGLDFRNDTAADFAYRDVVAQLVQNENGQWMHKTGASVKDFIDSFRKDEDKEFLFKPKQSSGTGQSNMQAPTGGFDSNKPLSEMSTEEIMAAAASGAFDDGKKWI
jgi:cation transport regulator ChaB